MRKPTGRRPPKHLANRRSRSARLQPGGSRATRRSCCVLVALLALVVVGCSTGQEFAQLTQFFAASRLRDLTALHKVATVVFEPTVSGTVTSFEITGVVDRGHSKEVSIVAPVRVPDGTTVMKRFTVTMQGGLVTAISEQPAQSQAERPAAASTPPP
jgi:hypothetical protein